MQQLFKCIRFYNKQNTKNGKFTGMMQWLVDFQEAQGAISRRENPLNCLYNNVEQKITTERRMKNRERTNIEEEQITKVKTKRLKIENNNKKK